MAKNTEPNPESAVNQTPCPKCGHCPTCGRSNYPTYPIYPDIRWYPPYQSYPQTTWACGTGYMTTNVN